MDSSDRCQNCDERETWLEQIMYTGQLATGNWVEINRIGICIK